jgi:hypothetical protein
LNKGRRKQRQEGDCFGQAEGLNRLRQEGGWNRGMQKHGTTEAKRRLEQRQAKAWNRQRQTEDGTEEGKIN